MIASKRDWAKEFEQRSEWIASVVKNAHANGVVFGNSGGKDCALVGILSKNACPETVGVVMPCQSARNFGEDKLDAEKLSAQFEIESIFVDVTPIKEAFEKQLIFVEKRNPLVMANMNPRIRMTVLYSIAQSRNLLVAGTGNLSERTMGYFTKHGDGACDFNPVADLTASEVLEFLAHLNAPKEILTKAPSAALFDGQTDEKEMGISYNDLDRFILTKQGSAQTIQTVERAFDTTHHKRKMPLLFDGKTASEKS